MFYAKKVKEGSRKAKDTVIKKNTANTFQKKPQIIRVRFRHVMNYEQNKQICYLLLTILRRTMRGISFIKKNQFISVSVYYENELTQT